MLRPVLHSVRLSFGAHDGEFDFPADPRPVVICGPNGSGKSTLVEGVLRTVFGFERRRGTDVARLEARRPWSGKEMWGEVTLRHDGETFRIRRDFSTARVRVDSPADGVVHFEGDGNPGATNHEVRHYRGILGELLGVADLDTYRRTLFISQGDLPHTVLGEHMLRVAAGGHALVDAARGDIAEQHRNITRRPLHQGGRGAINPRELEKLEDEIASLRTRLSLAREAAERRGPLAMERDRVAARLEELDGQIRSLEDARSALARSDVVELEARHVREWSRRLDRSADTLRQRAEEADAATAAARDASRGGSYPDDFQERLARVDVRWNELDALEGRPPRWMAVLGASTLLAAAALWYLALHAMAIASAGLGALVLAAWSGLRLDASRRRGSLMAQVRDDLADVPAAGTITPATRQRHLARFLGQRAASRRLEEARWDLAEAMREGRALLLERRALGIQPVRAAGRQAGSGRADRRDAGPADTGRAGQPRTDTRRGAVPAEFPAARRLESALLEAAADARDRLARGRYELERVGDASLDLPAGVPPTEDGVASALESCRQERTRAQRDLQQIGQELLERGTPADSVAALETALAELEPRRDALRMKAQVLEAAHALVTDAYDAFRDHDQERLVDHVSHHVRRLTDGRAGPLVVEDTLDEARVRFQGRVVPLASPPLSFGELHALLLGVRFGAADFLAGIGLLPPVLIDEPFAHLDGDRAASVWELLEAVARDRQVIVTTQDALRLGALGVTPDIPLQA